MLGLEKGMFGVRVGIVVSRDIPRSDILTEEGTQIERGAPPLP